MYSSAYIWGRVISRLEQELTAPVVSSYLDDADIIEVTETTLVLSTSSEFRKNTITGKLSPYIKEAMKQLFDRDIDLSVLTTEDAKKYRTAPAQPIMFNPQFTFDRFVVGSSNSMAHAAAVAVASGNGHDYNPLFIYGPSGLGKTHLLYAIAGEIHRNRPEAKLVYIKGEQFTVELIEAIQAGKNSAFREKYRNADLFLMDDIHFIAGKAETQEEFFNTFNTLYENGKQIVLTSDRSPLEVPKLEERLRTRFQWGLTVDIQPPDYETRMAIIKNKAYSLGILDFPDDVCNYIAENLTTNVRQLEGAVKNILAMRSLNGKAVDMELAKRAISTMFKGKAEVTPGLIISEVCSCYNVDEAVLRGNKRDKVTAEARQVAMYLIRNMAHRSYPEIGREFGKDHTTAIHSINKVTELLQDENSGIRDNIKDITLNINNKL